MNPQGLVSDALIQSVSQVDWWFSEDGQGFLKRQQLRQEWVNFLERFGFDVWFTVTFKDSANSAGLAIDRTVRLLRRACKGVKIECDAFIVAEEHNLGGTYHTHGMMRLGALNSQFEDIFLRYFWQVTFELYGRNRFSRIECDSAVGYYVAKYITKRFSDTEWLIVGCRNLRSKGNDY